MADTFDPSFFENQRKREVEFKKAKASAPKVEKVSVKKKQNVVPNRAGTELELPTTKTYFGKKVGK